LRGIVCTASTTRGPESMARCAIRRAPSRSATFSVSATASGPAVRISGMTSSAGSLPRARRRARARARVRVPGRRRSRSRSSRRGGQLDPFDQSGRAEAAAAAHGDEAALAVGSL
jgi:hypothetical protein